MLVAAVSPIIEYNIQRQVTFTAKIRRRKRQMATLENRVDIITGTSARTRILPALRISVEDRHPICRPKPLFVCKTVIA